ncbi:MAG: hypothetical protein WCG21_14270 [Eubacteriales bacterium]
MKHSFLQQRVMVLSLVIISGILSASCSTTTVISSSTEIKEEETAAVEEVKTADVLYAYLEEFKGGKVMQDTYESKLIAGSNPFVDLKFADDQSRTAMQAGMNRIKYEVKDITLVPDKESAECDVAITALDVLKIQSNLEDKEGGLYYDSFITAIQAEDAPVKTYDIKIVLSFDAGENEWKISNSPLFVGVFAKPYTKLVFDQDYSAASAALDSFMTALKQNDTKTIDLLCSGLSSSDFFPQDEFELLLSRAIYSAVKYSVSSQPQGTAKEVEIVLSLTMPDMDANYIEAYNDVDLVARSLKPAIVETLQGTLEKDAAYTYRKAFFTELASRLMGTDALQNTYEVRFTLTLDEQTQTWRITSAQTERLLKDFLTGYDPLLDLSAQHLQIAIESASAALLQEGTIDQTQQGDVNNYFIYVLIPETGDPFANITTTGWKDPSTGNDVAGYNSKTDTALMYVLMLSSDWGDFTGRIEWYNQNASIMFYQEDFSYNHMEGVQAIYAVYPPEENPKIGWLSPDTYKVVIYLSDGSILAESTVIVS